MLFGQDHVDRYIETGGAQGHAWQDTHCLLLTTTGRKSGKDRILPLIYGTHDGDFIVVASKGGAPEHPAWYVNLEADPHVKVQVKDDVFDAVARTASESERAELWPIMVKEWPAYDEYQEKTDRQIPVVVLTRA
jgi:deazaflavin-dependent oxidoreductase (nitroreductase family)